MVGSQTYGGFLKWWYPTTMGFPTKNDHWVFPKIGVFPPKWMVKKMENPYFLMDDLGIFGNTHMDLMWCDALS